VIDRLEHCWSPEQIAGRLRLFETGARVCHETIYQFIYGTEGRELALHRHLWRARRQRHPRFGRRPRRSTIPLEQTIAHRPVEVAHRRDFGHWECDLLVFQQVHGRANVTCMVERKSRVTRLLHNPDRRSASVIDEIGKVVGVLPAALRQTITFDRGSEFRAYRQLTQKHGLHAYFCDPHSPWQKGSVENANGRLRRFLPSMLDPSTLTPAKLHEVELLMNTTPRKCLGYRTPHETFEPAAAP
jgi:IS30 family transposase